MPPSIQEISALQDDGYARNNFDRACVTTGKSQMIVTRQNTACSDEMKYSDITALNQRDALDLNLLSRYAAEPPFTFTEIPSVESELAALRDQAHQAGPPSAQLSPLEQNRTINDQSLSLSRQSVQLLQSRGFSFEQAGNLLHHCGYYIYADVAAIPSLLDSMFFETNSRISSWWGVRTPPAAALCLKNKWVSPPPSSGLPQSADPIFTAARAQRWLVSIHPFNAGNGRASRFAQDIVLEILGFPPPLVPYMLNDFVTTEDELSAQLGVRMVRSLKILENCVQNPSDRSCAEVPDGNH